MPALGAGGREFESLIRDQDTSSNTAGMVLVVTHDFAEVKLRVRFSLPAPSTNYSKH